MDTAGVTLHGMELSGITPGGTVAVIGPGPIGLIAKRFARLLGAARIIVIGRGARLQAAAELGPDATINFEEQDPVARVRELTAGLSVDEAIECSGAEGTFPLEDFALALETFVNRKEGAIKVVIEPNGAEI